MKKMKEIVIDKYTIGFIILFLIAILSRTVLLDKFPKGIHEDEAGMMYDAYCMANFGTDRYLYENPVYLTNFGGGQSILYATIASLFIKIFGFSLWVVRLPAVIFSILTILLAYVLTKKYIGKKFALVLFFLMTICPWHIMQSRWGLDCNLLASFLMISVYTLLNSKKTWHYILTGIFWGLTLYTYALSYIILPLLFGILCVYLYYVRKITIKSIIITTLPIVILAIPLILVQIVNCFGLESMKLGPITIPRLYTYRIAEVGIGNILGNLNLFSPNNIFQLMFSADHNAFNSFKEFGTIYYIVIPFVAYGFIFNLKEAITSIKERKFRLRTVFFIQFITIFLILLLFANPQLYKLNPLFMLLLVFATEGILWLYHKDKTLGYLVIFILIITFIIFEIFYFHNINKKAGVAFNTDVLSLVNYLETEYPNQEIYLETDAIQQYIYVLLANKVSPYEFMQDMQIVQFENGDTEVIKAGRYHFLDFKIDKDRVYVLEENNLFKKNRVEMYKQILEKQGFQQKVYNHFLLYSFSE